MKNVLDVVMEIAGILFIMASAFAWLSQEQESAIYLAVLGVGMLSIAARGNIGRDK